MNRTLPALLVLPLVAFAADLPSGPPAAIDFSWRTHAGDFPKDKPGYLILTTEDAVRWSKMLPEFVKQKEAMGFRVYVATGKDYGAGKTGNAQAKQVRSWMREFNKRAGLKYALLIGDSNPRSGDLPSPTVPDGEHGGFEPAYCDLDGKWVDLYLETTEKDTRSGWTQMCAGSILLPKAMKASGEKRKDEVIIARISYVGNEVGNGAYDLDRILDKIIRYERETVAGKRLDWRARTLSVITNYGGTNWDDGLIHAVEAAGGAIEWRSNLGISGPYVPANIFDGKPANATLVTRVRRAGMVCSMSHGWNRGGEGTVSQPGLFRDMDDRWPASVGFTSCTAFALADNCNMGQAWLRKGAVFACGTGWSGNNNARVPLQSKQMSARVSVGEAVGNAVVVYGDPSLHVLPPEGTPVCDLQIQPAFADRYEERTLADGGIGSPVAETYTLTNRSKDPMTIAVECDAAWVSLSGKNLSPTPGESVKIEARSNGRLARMAHGVHVANVRFLRSDGQRDERRLAVNLQPVSLSMVYSFDSLTENNRAPDLVAPTAKNAWSDHTSLWLSKVARGPHWRPTVKLGDKLYSIDPKGRVGGALKSENPGAPFTRGLPGFTRWRGTSAAFWFKVDALPEAKKSLTILKAPFALSLDSSGTLAFASGGRPGSLGSIKTGEWHYVLFRSDVAAKTIRASLDGRTEVVAAAPKPPADALSLGSFSGAFDEVRIWSGELSSSAAAKELANAGSPFVASAPGPVPAYLDDGVLRAPKDIPALFDPVDVAAKLDLAKTLADAKLTCTGLREAPAWLEFKDGVLAFKPGTDFDRIDFGGYDFFLVLKSDDGRTCEHALKVRIPVPAVNIRIARAADNTLTIVNAGDRFGGPGRPLAKGVIRYTTDGSPVSEKSPVYTGPFKPPGDKVTARFFYLGEYPYAPVTLGTEFGIPRDKWKPVAVSGKPGRGGLPAVGSAIFDGNPGTAWKDTGGEFPRFFAWDLGRSETLVSITVQSDIRSADGRIAGYVLHASDDGKNWKTVKTGEMENSPNPVRISFSAPIPVRYFKLEVTSLHGGKNLVISEIEAYAVQTADEPR